MQIISATYNNRDSSEIKIVYDTGQFSFIASNDPDLEAWLALSPNNQIAPYVAPPAIPRTCTMNEWNTQMNSTTQLESWLALRTMSGIKAKDAAYLSSGGDDNRFCETNARFSRLVGKLINSTDATAITTFIKTAFDAIYAARVSS